MLNWPTAYLPALALVSISFAETNMIKTSNTFGGRPGRDPPVQPASLKFQIHYTGFRRKIQELFVNNRRRKTEKVGKGIFLKKWLTKGKSYVIIIFVVTEKSPSLVYGARLELVYGLIAHRGFESLLLRHIKTSLLIKKWRGENPCLQGFSPFL